MFTAGDSTAPIWALIGSLLTLAGVVYKQRRDEKREKRLTSGTVETTQAGRLWEASEQVRHDMAASIERLTLRVAYLDGRVESLEEQVGTLRTQLRAEEDKNG